MNPGATPHGIPATGKPGSGQDSHYENFPVASWLCPPRLRPAIAAIYWFARTADDLADEGDATPGERLKALAAYRADLEALIAGREFSERWPHVFAPLKPVMREFALPPGLLRALLSAFEQDIVQNRYADEAQLHDYCQRSANPVGRLLLHLYGVTGDDALRESDAICTALQLINFWQDLSVDLPRGRLYLPVDLCHAHGVSEAQLLRREATPSAIELIAACARSARATMLKGSQLVKKIPGRTGWELRLVVQGGLRILDKIEALGSNTLETRPKLDRLDFAVMGWRALWM